MDIGTGAGLAGATGVRPFLPPLLAGALARGDIGIDFDGTDWSFLESPGFLAAVLALGVVAYLLERSEAAGAAASGAARGAARRDRGIVLGALLFAGALADGGERELARPRRRAAVRGARLAAPWAAWSSARARRLDGGAAALLTVYADAAALVLAALAIFVPPLSFLALIGFVVLLVGGRRREGEKYAGLRILR